jgi:hypothetical protein
VVVVIITAITYGIPMSGEYGYWVFLGLPTLQGLLSSICLEINGPVRFSTHVLTDLIALTLLLTVLQLLAFEGLICIVMVAPIVLLASIAGQESPTLLHLPYAEAGAQQPCFSLPSCRFSWSRTR